MSFYDSFGWNQTNKELAIARILIKRRTFHTVKNTTEELILKLSVQPTTTQAPSGQAPAATLPTTGTLKA
jgi:hypothetical protein